MHTSITIIVCSVLLLGGCHFGSHGEEEHFEQKLLTDIPPEIKVPSIMWDLLEEKKVIDSHNKIVPIAEGSPRLDENVFVGVTVRLREKTPGVLGGKNFELKAPKSGLSIDLARYVKMDKGTFIISIEPEYTLDPMTAQVLFLSQSVKRNIHGQPVGGGCREFFDITKNYLKDIRSNGIEVNVTDGRHVSLLAGTFFIRVSHEKGVRALTQLTISDSNHPELQCDGNTGDDEKE